MNEQDFAEGIARKLDEGLDSLPPATLYRLRLARDTALSRAHLEESEPRPAGAARLLNRRVLVPLFMLILGLSVIVVWQRQPAPQPDYTELDTQVLTDELPVTAYLDTGFEVWMYHHATD
jgi:hypothetical protein